jgi:hypothetical protein
MVHGPRTDEHDKCEAADMQTGDMYRGELMENKNTIPHFLLRITNARVK